MADEIQEAAKSDKGMDALRKRYIADTSGVPDDEFLDNLSALSRFKDFLVGKGVDIPDKVIVSINELTFVFADDLAAYECRLRSQGQHGEVKGQTPSSADLGKSDPSGTSMVTS